MPALLVPALALAGLLVLAGVQKLLDPTMTVGALRAMRLPSSTALVRVGSAAEAALGLAALVVGGPVLWLLVAASYAAFGVFVAVAMREGTMIGSCGCFGREETPPHVIHLALNAVLAALAVGVALTDANRPLDALGADIESIVAVALAAGTIALLLVAFITLPRVLTAAGPQRRQTATRLSDGPSPGAMRTSSGPNG